MSETEGQSYAAFRAQLDQFVAGCNDIVNIIVNAREKGLTKELDQETDVFTYSLLQWAKQNNLSYEHAVGALAASVVRLHQAQRDLQEVNSP